MDKFKQTLISIENDEFSVFQLVSILILIVSKINIRTLQGMAASEGKTRRGIEISNRYKKVNIGGKVFAVSGIREDSLPF